MPNLATVNNNPERRAIGIEQEIAKLEQQIKAMTSLKTDTQKQEFLRQYYIADALKNTNSKEYKVLPNSYSITPELRINYTIDKGLFNHLKGRGCNVGISSNCLTLPLTYNNINNVIKATESFPGLHSGSKNSILSTLKKVKNAGTNIPIEKFDKLLKQRQENLKTKLQQKQVFLSKNQKIFYEKAEQALQEARTAGLSQDKIQEIENKLKGLKTQINGGTGTITKINMVALLKQQDDIVKDVAKGIQQKKLKSKTKTPMFKTTTLKKPSSKKLLKNKMANTLQPSPTKTKLSLLKIAHKNAKGKSSVPKYSIKQPKSKPKMSTLSKTSVLKNPVNKINTKPKILPKKLPTNNSKGLASKTPLKPQILPEKISTEKKLPTNNINNNNKNNKPLSNVIKNSGSLLKKNPIKSNNIGNHSADDKSKTINSLGSSGQITNSNLAITSNQVEHNDSLKKAHSSISPKPNIFISQHEELSILSQSTPSSYQSSSSFSSTSKSNSLNNSVLTNSTSSSDSNNKNNSVLNNSSSYSSSNSEDSILFQEKKMEEKTSTEPLMNPLLKNDSVLLEEQEYPPVYVEQVGKSINKNTLNLVSQDKKLSILTKEEKNVEFSGDSMSNANNNNANVNNNDNNNVNNNVNNDVNNVNSDNVNKNEGVPNEENKNVIKDENKVPNDVKKEENVVNKIMNEEKMNETKILSKSVLEASNKEENTLSEADEKALRDNINKAVKNTKERFGELAESQLLYALDNCNPNERLILREHLAKRLGVNQNGVDDRQILNAFRDLGSDEKIDLMYQLELTYPNIFKTKDEILQQEHEKAISVIEEINKAETDMADACKQNEELVGVLKNNIDALKEQAESIKKAYYEGKFWGSVLEFFCYTPREVDLLNEEIKRQQIVMMAKAQESRQMIEQTSNIDGKDLKKVGFHATVDVTNEKSANGQKLLAFKKAINAMSNKTNEIGRLRTSMKSSTIGDFVEKQKETEKDLTNSVASQITGIRTTDSSTIMPNSIKSSRVYKDKNISKSIKI